MSSERRHAAGVSPMRVLAIDGFTWREGQDPVKSAVRKRVTFSDDFHFKWGQSLLGCKRKKQFLIMSMLKVSELSPSPHRNPRIGAVVRPARTLRGQTGCGCVCCRPGGGEAWRRRMPVRSGRGSWRSSMCTGRCRRHTNGRGSRLQREQPCLLSSDRDDGSAREPSGPSDRTRRGKWLFEDARRCPPRDLRP